MKYRYLLLISGFLFFGCQHPDKKPAPVQPVPFTQVEINDKFWAPKIETNRKVSIPTAFQQCEITGRIDNFAIAGKVKTGEHKGDFPFDDTDVYKVIEGSSYSLASGYDAKLDHYLDSIIAYIAVAQEPDGYIYTCRTNNCTRLERWMGKSRWEKLNSHELYNLGHLYEAAVAHFQATGKRTLLDVAIKSANLVAKDFGPGPEQKKVPSGHPIIEMALVKLYRVTNDTTYLNLASFFIEETGRGTDGHPLSPYSQDHKPVVDQDEIVGHAVRAGYLYSGVTDVAMMLNDEPLKNALFSIWDNLTSKKLYITGGMGSRAQGEGFGENYELPNMTGYCETCAAISNVYWNYRMFLLTGDSKYIDILEKALYNGVISGVSLSGDHYFYDNPLTSDGTHCRQEWFGCACCPSNITRFLPSVPGYIYGVRDDEIFVNLFVAGKANIKTGNTEVMITQTTDYPWDGSIKLEINPDQASFFKLRIRMPSWLDSLPQPGGLYFFTDRSSQQAEIKLNGEKVRFTKNDGFATISRKWKKEDVVEVTFPMEARKMKTIDTVEANRGLLAIQRGPIVYCTEGADYPDSLALDVYLNEKTVLTPVFDTNLLNGVVKLTGQGHALKRNDKNEVIDSTVDFLAIPYYAWQNRGMNEMTVWIPESVDFARCKPLPTLASQSIARSSTDWTPGLNDQFEPSRSSDIYKPYFYWWLRKGTDEWVEYEFPEETTISSSGVYWLVFDHYDGNYRPPVWWNLEYKSGNGWKKVENLNNYEVLTDQYNTVNFKPVKTKFIRLNAKLHENTSGGIVEWKVE